MSRIAAVLIVCLALIATACSSEQRSPLEQAGRDIYTGAGGCVACHGGRGQGGTGPRLSNLAAVFPSCDEQVEWVRLGSQQWLEQHGPTYGATNEVVDGEMPDHEDLTDEELRLVVAYERMTFSNMGEAEVVADCGIEIPAP